MLGRGGMGTVYRGVHLALGTRVAIKTLTSRSGSERFLREARIAARIRSPHVVTVLDVDELADGTPIIVMELVDGESLADIIAEHGPVDDDTLLRLMTDAAAGMIAAAELGVVHRDLKPANLMIERSGRLRVTDFGLARADALEVMVDAATADLTASHALMGTPLYMAPEQAESPRFADVRSDVYGFGATFYHAATGRPPFTGTSVVDLLVKHRVEVPPPPRAWRPALAPRLSEVIERSLAKSPADRFQSFTEVREALGKADVSPWREAFDPVVEQFLRRYGAHRDRILGRGASPGELARFGLTHGRTLSIVRGNLATTVADALVSSDDERLSMSGGVSQALNQASGGLLAAEARRFAQVRHGGVVVTGGGQLQARFVLHAVTIDYSHPGATPSRDVLLRVMAGCFYHADTLQLRSLAFPLLGTGAGGFPREVCLDTMVGYLVRTLVRGGTSVEEVTIVLR
jgi:O-acetyl-ADP-ribose deacetylase (regulator of RNase III)